MLNNNERLVEELKKAAPDMDAVRRLVHAATDLAATPEQERTPLLTAICGGHCAAVEMILKKRPALACAKSQNEVAPLYWAVFWEQENSVRLLLDAGAGIDHKNIWGNTALMTAARYGYKSIIGILLAGGADIQVVNDEGGKTALDFAIAAGDEDCCTLLKNAGLERTSGDDATRMAVTTAIRLRGPVRLRGSKP